MEVKLHDIDDARIIELIGEFDYLNAEEIRVQILEVIEQGFPRLIVNLEKVSYIDSTGIGILISSWTKAKNHNTKIVYACLRGAVEKVIHLSRLHMVLPIASTVEEAMNS